MIKPKLTNAAYVVERAICDKANKYRNDITLGKRNYLTAIEAKHKDYKDCTNAMRGRVEQYEILNGKYDYFVAYLNDDYAATTWTGDLLSHDSVCTGEWSINSYLSNTMSQHTFKIGKREYTGRGLGKGMSIILRETAKSKRLNPK